MNFFWGLGFGGFGGFGGGILEEFVIASRFLKNGVAIYGFKRKFNPMDCHEFARLCFANSRNDENSLSY